MAIKRQSSPFEVFKRHCGAKRSKPSVVRDAVAAWSDLPDGILELITDKMSSITDLTRFRFVCKNWNSFHKIKPLLPQHPWLLCYDDNDNSYRLFEPFSDVEICRSDFPLKDFHVCASKKGWLLLCHNTSPGKVIAYSPFTAKVIALPPMKFTLASFSTCPSDPDCVFFTLNESPFMGRTTIAIWKQNEPNWRAIEVAGIHLMKSVIFSSGSFYCSNQNGLLGVFSIQDQSWRIVVEIDCAFISLLDVIKPCESHLVEFNGQIFLVFSSMSRRWIFEPDLCKKQWKIKDGLKEVALFLDGPVAIATAASVTKSIDKVYYIKGRSDEQGCKKLWIEPPSY